MYGCCMMASYTHTGVLVSLRSSMRCCWKQKSILNRGSASAPKQHRGWVWGAFLNLKRVWNLPAMHVDPGGFNSPSPHLSPSPPLSLSSFSSLVLDPALPSQFPSQSNPTHLESILLYSSVPATYLLN